MSRSVCLVKAEDWDDAREKVLRRGLGMEEDYEGGGGARVRWRLMRIETLDQLGKTIADGREVYSEALEPSLEEDYPLDVEFRPQDSMPNQSGV